MTRLTYDEIATALSYAVHEVNQAEFAIAVAIYSTEEPSRLHAAQVYRDAVRDRWMDVLHAVASQAL